MANLKASIKDIRKARARATRNARARRVLKQVVKEYQLSLKENDTEKTQELLAHSYKVLDKAAKNHVIHKNAAARKKSRLAQLLVHK